VVVTDPAPLPPDHPDTEVVAALRGGDADRFDDLVRDLTPGMVRIARMYVSGALADDVVQDTWLAVIDAIDTFEGRSSLKTWIYRILLNKVRTLASREARAVPVSSLGADHDPAGPRLELVHEKLGPGYWPAPPEPWETLGPERLERNEILDRIAEAIEALPTAQREVVELRDVQGWSASDTADLLGITDVNQRVLLHRGRRAIRNALEEYLRAS
jgi:RNA polymerase sigma-70 factor (ECF subfamily)